jgi:hypothetical protein
LDRAGAAYLVQPTEAAVGAARTEAARQHLCRAPKQRAGQIVDRRTEVRTIKDVEELSPEAEIDLRRQLKAPLHREVDLKCPNPRKTFRPKLPCCPVSTGLNAAALTILPPGYGQ